MTLEKSQLDKQERIYKYVLFWTEWQVQQNE